MKKPTTDAYNCHKCHTRHAVDNVVAYCASCYAEAHAAGLAAGEAKRKELQALREIGERLSLVAWQVHQMLKDRGEDTSLKEISDEFNKFSGAMKDGGSPVSDEIADLKTQLAEGEAKLLAEERRRMQWMTDCEEQEKRAEEAESELVALESKHASGPVTRRVGRTRRKKRY